MLWVVALGLLSNRFIVGGYGLVRESVPSVRLKCHAVC